jgi:hypothetical protein
LILFSPDKHTVNLQTGNGTPKTIKKYGFKDLKSGFLRKLKKIDEVRKLFPFEKTSILSGSASLYYLLDTIHFD